jgi:hypothetical protein
MDETCGWSESQVRCQPRESADLLLVEPRACTRAANVSGISSGVYVEQSLWSLTSAALFRIVPNATFSSNQVVGTHAFQALLQPPLLDGGVLNVAVAASGNFALTITPMEPVNASAVLRLVGFRASNDTVRLAAGTRYRLQSVASLTTSHVVLINGSVLNASLALANQAGNCSALQNCTSCSAMSDCGWCDGACVPRASAEAQSCSALFVEPSSCIPCTSYISCLDCTRATTDNCFWSTNTCLQVNSPTPPGAARATTPAQCPTPCPERANCTACLQPDDFHSYDLCAWFAPERKRKNKEEREGEKKRNKERKKEGGILKRKKTKSNKMGD